MRDERPDGAEIEKRAIYTENDSNSEAFGWFVLISILGFNGIGNELYGRNSRSRSLYVVAMHGGLRSGTCEYHPPLRVRVRREQQERENKTRG